MLTSSQFFLIIGMALVTYIPRALPIALFANQEISPSIQKWLTYIPGSVFAALVCSDVFFWQNQVTLSIVSNKKLIPSLLVLLVALKTKSLMWSISVGVLSLATMIYIF